MRSIRYLLLLIVLIVLITPSSALRPHYRPRQDQDNNDAAASTEVSSSQSPETTGESEPASSTRDESASVTAAPSSDAESFESSGPASPTEDGAGAVPTSVIYNGECGELPLQPRISPAVGLGGAILMLTGAAYTFIGVRHQVVQIFFSTAYLASLSVTVLIEYVVKANVSDGVQGGYLVAIISAGLILGGLTFIFKDMVEGLCCLLGGFCLSMWFLTLKDGGLIQSTAGKCAFIAALTIFSFALSFTRYTRLYASIGCIAFAGATIIILGIDCFTRAGYKEFWIYLWNLNNRAIFPLETNTYPITRGIRVEIAAIVILALFGVISQMKLWKVVRERKEQKTAAEKERQDQLNALDSEANLRFHNEVSREQDEWEAAHGDKDESKVIAESKSSVSDNAPKFALGFDSHQSSARSSQTSPPESVEMMRLGKIGEANEPYLMSAGTGGANNPTVTINLAQEDDIRHVDANGNVYSPPQDSVYSNSFSYWGTDPKKNPGGSVIEKVTLSEKLKSDDKTNVRTSLRPSAPPPPPIIPLPLPIFNRTDKDTRHGIDEESESRRGSKRLSASAALKRLSEISLGKSQEASESQEDLIVPHIEDDRRSSLAATLDDLDKDDLSIHPGSRPTSCMSRPNSWMNIKDELPKIDIYEADGAMSPVSETRPRSFLDATSEHDTLASSNVLSEKSNKQVDWRGSLTPSTNPKISTTGSIKGRRLEEKPSRESMLSVKEETSNAEISRPGTPSSDKASFEAEVTEQLPEKLSKTALLYRTNEWIKHAADADQDGLENPLAVEPESPGIRIETGFAAEAAAPVDVEELSKTIAETIPVQNDTPIPDPRRASGEVRPSSSYGRSNTMERLERPVSRNISPTVSTENVIQEVPTISTPSLSRHGSATKLSMRGFRSSSTPIIEQIVPEALDEDGPQEMRNVITPLPTNTLMSRRESMMRSRMTSMAFNSSSTPNLVSSVKPSDSASVRNMASPSPLNDADDMPLAERKQILQQRRNSGPQRPASYQVPEPVQAIQAPAIYDSHQPKRTLGIDQAEQAERMARWRMSQREVGTSSRQSGFLDEARRQAMIQNQRQSQMAKQQQENAAVARDAVFEDMMRRNDMQDLHREAMRKMQAKANKAT